MAQEPAPHSSRQRVAGPLAAALVLGCIACLAVRATASPAPFGVALPQPRPRIVSANVDFKATDVLGKRIPPAYLEFLAPQPDGTPPLRYPYASIRGGFDVSHPMGAELTQAPANDPASADLDAVVLIHYNQPLQGIRYVLPGRQNGEKVTEFMARMRFEMERLGWEILPQPAQRLDLPRYRFERLEFVTRPPAGAEQADGKSAELASVSSEQRFWFAGPLGDRLLLVEFSAKPENAVLARKQAEKIMASFSPRLDLALAMLEEDPNYGEWAGTPNVKLAQERKQKRAELRRAVRPPVKGK